MALMLTTPVREYRGKNLDRIAFPMGGIGAGMICLEGTAALSHVSLRHRPDVFHEPLAFSALCVHGHPNVARVLEGPVPLWKAFGSPGSGNGGKGTSHGLPRFRAAAFSARFPFGTVTLEDPAMPCQVTVTGWSPFVPGDPDSASLPVCALEYTITNTTRRRIRATYSFHAENFMRLTRQDGKALVRPIRKGFRLIQPRIQGAPASHGEFTAIVEDPKTRVDCAWFRGSWFDPLTMLWKTILSGTAKSRAPHARGEASRGASLYLPFDLRPGKSRSIRLLLSWYVPKSDIRVGAEPDGCCSRGAPPKRRATYEPWYAGRFTSMQQVASFWRQHVKRLRQATETFTQCFYDTTLPSEVVDAIAANLTILKSPTSLRQRDGRFWGWEGCCDASGCCAGTCTHVWNYAQALPHLFPRLARTLRETEFLVNQDARGHQHFRSSLPIRPPAHGGHAAADGQLGGIMKLHREWRISGDSTWLRRLWPKAKQSLLYCISAWDPDHKGVLVEPHHNTYDIEFWGPNGMCSTFYLGALQAAIHMGKAMGDDVSLFEELLAKGLRFMEKRLWNGSYYIQKVQWKGLRAANPVNAPSLGTNYTPEALALLRREGPKYQYGQGCLADGILGEWIAQMTGVGPVLPSARVKRNLASIFTHNFRPSLSAHANPQRPTYAFGQEGGLLACTWPHGGALSLPFVYSNEVWTGIEYQVAAHLMLTGQVSKGLKIVRTVRKRYDGRVRNPFNEYECGHWYARAMSSYGMLQSLTGLRYDGVDKVLYVRPQIKGNWRSFLSTATGFGTVSFKSGKASIVVRHGRIPVERIEVLP